MRLLISDVADLPFGTAMPLHANVPGLLLDDELFMLLCAALDELLVPDVVALDCFAAYLDTRLTPEDFLPWLGALVGAAPQREAIAGATARYALRGTAAGLRTVAAHAAGVAEDAVDVDDPGGARWSATPGAAPVAAHGPARVRVRVRAAAATPELIESVRMAVEPSRPVHCPIEVEVVTS